MDSRTSRIEALIKQNRERREEAALLMKNAKHVIARSKLTMRALEVSLATRYSERTVELCSGQTTNKGT